MKKLTTSSILFLISLLLNSQELKKVILRKCNRNVSEVYQVRRSDDSTKEGLSQQFFCFISNNLNDYIMNPERQQEMVREMGYYKNGKKDSFWTIRQMPFVIDEQGMYKEDEKVGVWKKVKKIQNGYVHEFYNYTNKIALEPEIIVNLAYPAFALEKEIEGVVGLTFDLKKDCTIENLKVVNSVGGGCDEEAMQKIKRLYELKKAYNCKCEEKAIIEKVTFRLE